MLSNMMELFASLFGVGKEPKTAREKADGIDIDLTKFKILDEDLAMIEAIDEPDLDLPTEDQGRSIQDGDDD